MFGWAAIIVAVAISAFVLRADRNDRRAHTH